MQKGLWSDSCAMLNVGCSREGELRKVKITLWLMCGCACTCLRDHSKIVPVRKEPLGRFGCALNSVVECSKFSLVEVFLCC